MKDLKAKVIHWPSVYTGDTFPEINTTVPDGEADLSRVRMEFNTVGTSTPALTLDSDASGITINTATAGAWDFTFDAIPEVSLDAGFYPFDIEVTTAAGDIRTEFRGVWRILEDQTDT